MQKATKRWELVEIDKDLVSRISIECGMSEELATVLINRGITTPEAIRSYLSPSLANMSDPFLMKGMREAVDRIIGAMQNGEVIGGCFDMDSDGAGAAAIFTMLFRDLGYEFHTVIPSRYLDGYGVHESGINELIGKGVTLVITGDVGVTSHSTALYAKAMGVDLVITDHHTCPDVLPEAVAIVNPHQKGCQFPYKFLAGAGVAFYLIVALRSEMRAKGFFKNSPEPDIRKYLDIVALSTIGDLVALTGENRMLAAAGLDRMNKAPSMGIEALIAVSRLKCVSATDVAFMLSPRINAAGRILTANHSLDLLAADNFLAANELASLLDTLNTERKDFCEQTTETALRLIAARPEMWRGKSIVLASPDFMAGVHGISSSKLIEMFNKPTILIAVDEAKGIGKGSCRSIPGFDIHAGLAACSRFLIGFGGHVAAAGFSIKQCDIPSFVDAFESYAQSVLSDEDMEAVLEIDLEIAGDNLTMALHEELQQMQPVGMSNRQAVFALKNVHVHQERILKEKHLKLTLGVGGKFIDGIGFNMAELGGNKLVDVAFCLDVNEWRDTRSLQLMLKDVRPAGRVVC